MQTFEVNIKAMKLLTIKVNADTMEQANEIALNSVKQQFKIASIIDITDIEYTEKPNAKEDILSNLSNVIDREGNKTDGESEHTE